MKSWLPVVFLPMFLAVSVRAAGKFTVADSPHFAVSAPSRTQLAGAAKRPKPGGAVVSSPRTHAVAECCNLTAGDRVAFVGTNFTGTVVCCDLSDPQLPLLVSWDGMTELGDCDQLQWCQIPTSPPCDASGSYAWVSCEDIGVEVPCDPIEFWQCLIGELTEEDLPLGDGTYYDRYCFDSSEGETIGIDMVSEEFDTYIHLWGPNGEYYYDDDGGEGVNSRLHLTLPSTGTWEIWAGSYAPATGEYTLCLAQLEPTPTPTCIAPETPEAPWPPDRADDIPVDVTLRWNLPAGTNRPQVIYGPDDRRDVYEITDPAVLAAWDSTVALISVFDLFDIGGGMYQLPPTTFGETYGLCESEPYRNQPNPAWCSGFLVAPDLVATAGHCVSDQGTCSQVAFVFGFRMLDANTPVTVIPASEVYFCAGIVAREQRGDGSDWALVRLDRPVEGHVPLPIRRTGKIADNQAVFVIGHPSGLPAKIAGGANVRDNNPVPYFVANLDTYGGNSGSAVFNAQTLEVEGILVRGAQDFVYTPENCWVSNRCPDDGCRGEDVTRTTMFADLIEEKAIYHVYVGPCDAMAYAGDTQEPRWPLNSLLPGQDYCWQVIAENACGQAVGPIWTFRTRAVEPPFVWGDLNGDEIAGAVDASLVLQFDAFLIEQFPCCPGIVWPDFPVQGNVNADAILGSVDAAMILQYDAFLLDCFHDVDFDCDGWGPEH